MKKIFTFLMMLFASMGILRAADFPMDFETGTFTFLNFDGGNTTVVANPHISGINTSAKVAKMVKSAGQTWGGSYIVLSAPIDFSEKKLFKMKVFSPRVGAKVLLKAENMDNGSIALEKVTLTTVANEWEELSFDFSLIDVTKSYQKLVFIFDNGTMGDGSANFTFFFDDIVLTTSDSETEAPVLPLDFESATIDYAFNEFDGGVVTVIDNPHSSGINTSAKVAKMVKNAGQPWGGSWIALASPIDFSVNKTFKMKVYSPRVGAKVLLKVENYSDGSIAFEKEVATTVANVWEELIFDFSGINTSNSYQKLTFIFELGTMGDGTANFTFLFDDIELFDGSGGLSQIDLPVTFDVETVNYTMTDFGGNASEIVTDPAGGTNNVAKVTKTAGAETWAGTTIGTASGYASKIPFTAALTKISVRVYSPAAGIRVRLKVEAHNDPTLTAETEAITTVANQWETLTFDFSKVATGTNPWNPAINFNKMSIFFDFGNTGTGSVFYFDDVVFVTTTFTGNILTDLVRVYSGNGKIHVNNISDFINGNIEVYEVTGRKIVAKTIRNSNEAISINKTGIFIVRISDAVNQPVLVRKLVIQ
jgi:hypothetical protein